MNGRLTVDGSKNAALPLMAAPLLTSEHMFPWMLEQAPGLAALKPCAELLAAKDNWEPLYDTNQLASNTVPVAAIVYHDDLCVGYPYSIDCSKRVANVKRWVTSEYAHDGIGEDGERIVKRLLGMLKGDLER